MDVVQVQVRVLAQGRLYWVLVRFGQWVMLACRKCLDRLCLSISALL